MSTPLRVSVAIMTAAALAGSSLQAAAAPPVPPATTYTVSVGATTKPYQYPDDAPATPYIDKDGTFYFQQSHALYEATASRQWNFYTGSNFDTATKSATISGAVNPADSRDKNSDTTWRCNNSPTGLESTYVNNGAGSYSQRNYCDLIGTWVDPDTGNWIGLVHNEFTPQPFGDGLHYDSIDYAVSTNQGKVWTIKGHVITSPYSTKRGDTTAFPNQTYNYGDGDQRLFVDTASGYFYVYYGSRVIPKAGAGGGNGGLAHVARAPLSGKMATGSWSKWYNGGWTQPGVGGLESNMVPVTASNQNGYTPTADDYDPANTGNADQQIAAGQLPAKSDLFIMNITYNAYLGLYLGEPEVVSGVQTQRFYVTDNLATQKWYLIGDSGNYKSGSWYRWFLDPVNKTSSTIVGRSFRSYCSIACATSDGEYADLSIDSTSPAAPVLDPTKTYRVANGNGRVLAQVSGSTSTTSLATATGSTLEAWSFAPNGDGSYRIANASTGRLLGADSTGNAGRAWGAALSVTAPGTTGPTPGQQWFVVPNTSSSGTLSGGYRLVNRYSGLVLGMSSQSGRLTESTPVRHWTNSTGDPVGGSRTGAEQALTMTAVGVVANLNGVHTVTANGKALDDPDWSKATGTQFITWSPSGQQNQSWNFAQQTDGTYTISNGYSQLCADAEGGSTTAGTKVIQWTCTGRSNQRWIVTPTSSGYLIVNAHSGLPMTTASSTDGSKVTQETTTGAVGQQWSVS